MKAILYSLIILFGLSQISIAQQAFEEQNLKVKKRFSAGEVRALAIPFEGVLTTT